MNGTIATITDPTGVVLAIDLAEVYELEARKDEIPSITKPRAPELMRALERGYSICGQFLAQVVAAVNRIDHARDRRKAVVMLDVAPRILKEKGAGNNDASRSAIVDLDEEYGALQEQLLQAKALQELLKVKVRGFEMSFSAVKRVYDSVSNFSMDAGAAQNNRGGGVQFTTNFPSKFINNPSVTTGTPPDDLGIAIGRVST